MLVITAAPFARGFAVFYALKDKFGNIVTGTYVYCMKDITNKRKEVWLGQPTIDRLQVLADKKGWSLKQYMEYVLYTRSFVGNLTPSKPTKK